MAFVVYPMPKNIRQESREKLNATFSIWPRDARSKCLPRVAAAYLLCSLIKPSRAATTAHDVVQLLRFRF